MVDVIRKYTCELCGKTYESRDRARECEQQGMPEQEFDVGDIVTVGDRYGWFDGDPAWVIDPESVANKNDPDDTTPAGEGQTGFYWVVTAIDQPKGEHSWRYHLYTKAYDGQSGPKGGYTFINTHVPPERIDDPPETVVEDSEELIGQKATALI